MEDKLTLRNADTGGTIEATRKEHERVYTEAKGWHVVDGDDTPEPVTPAELLEDLVPLAELDPDELAELEDLTDEELADLAALSIDPEA